MAYIDKRLAKFAMGGGKFIKLDVGDSFKGTYQTWRSEVDEKYKKTKFVFIFRNEKGEEKQLSTSSKKVIEKMARIIPGSLLQLTKIGEAMKLDYSIKVLKEGRLPSQETPDEEPIETAEEVSIESPDTENAETDEELEDDLF